MWTEWDIREQTDEQILNVENYWKALNGVLNFPPRQKVHTVIRNLNLYTIHGTNKNNYKVEVTFTTMNMANCRHRLLPSL